MTIPLIKDDSDNEKEKENKLSINSEEEEVIIDNKKKENEESNLINEEGRVLPKLCFCEFYLNKIYFKICKRRKKQEIINICNKLGKAIFCRKWKVNRVSVENPSSVVEVSGECRWSDLEVSSK